MYIYIISLVMANAYRDDGNLFVYLSLPSSLPPFLHPSLPPFVPPFLSPSHPSSLPPSLPSFHPSLQASADPHPAGATAGEGGEGVGDMDIPLDHFTFDPHLGVSENGDETEI